MAGRNHDLPCGKNSIMITRVVEKKETVKIYQRIITGWQAALLVLFSLPLLAFAYLGTFTRFHADDFCMVGQVYRQGFWDSAILLYQQWSGRFTSTFFAQIFGMGGPNFARIFPTVLIVIWLINLSWLFHQVFRLSMTGNDIHPHEEPSSGVSLLTWLTAGSSLFFLLSTIPNLYQSFFWENGWVSYTFPLIWLTFTISLVLHFYQSRSSALGLAKTLTISSLAFVNGGFSEVYSATQLSLYALFFVLCFGIKERANRFRLMTLLGAAFIGAFAGFILVAAAPGNVSRQMTLEASGHPNLFELVLTAARHAYITGHALVKHDFLPILATLVTMFTIGFASLNPQKSSTRKSIRHKGWLAVLILLLPVTFGVVTASMAPTQYVMGSYPDARVLIVPYFVITMCIALFGLVVGLCVKSLWPRYKLTILIPCVIFSLLLGGYVTIRNTLDSYNQISTYQAYTSQWDIRHENLLQAKARGETEVHAAGLPQYHGLFDLAGKPDNWINVCLAIYYGFERVYGR
jgi:hypothetical protein